MAGTERERKSRRFFFLLILCLLVVYAGVKYRHIDLAMQSYQGQVLQTRNARGGEMKTAAGTSARSAGGPS